MRSVIFVSRYFFPDHSASSQILSDLAFDLAATGLPVHVVTSRQIYDDASARMAARESVDGVEVHRVWTTTFGRSSLAGRLLDYLTFYLAAGVRIAAVAGRGDIIVAKTDPPLISVIAAAVAKLRGA